MKIKFTKLPTTDEIIKISLDGGQSFTEVELSFPTVLLLLAGIVPLANYPVYSQTFRHGNQLPHSPQKPDKNPILLLHSTS